jgi:F-type H+-transporting ATPase subunit b
MRTLIAALFALTATPALAAGDVFVSLKNTDFVVLIAFALFIAILLYYKVPSLVGKMLDGRADTIRNELEEARALRDEAQSLLASYERKQKEVQEQADRIVSQAKDEAAAAGAQAKADIKSSVARRLAGAQEQIEAVKAAAIKEIRNQAVTVAIGAANDILAKQMDAKGANALIDDAIAEVGAKLH